MEEACLEAGYNYQTIKDYLYLERDTQKYPQIEVFREGVKRARNFIKLISRRTLVTAIKDRQDVSSAKYVISNRDKRYQGGIDENGNRGINIVLPS